MSDVLVLAWLLLFLIPSLPEHSVEFHIARIKACMGFLLSGRGFTVGNSSDRIFVFVFLLNDVLRFKKIVYYNGFHFM